MLVNFNVSVLGWKTQHCPPLNLLVDNLYTTHLVQYRSIQSIVLDACLLNLTVRRWSDTKDSRRRSADHHSGSGSEETRQWTQILVITNVCRNQVTSEVFIQIYVLSVSAWVVFHFPPTVQKHAGMANWRYKIIHVLMCDEGPPPVTSVIVLSVNTWPQKRNK